MNNPLKICMKNESKKSSSFQPGIKSRFTMCKELILPTLSKIWNDALVRMKRYSDRLNTQGKYFACMCAFVTHLI